MKYLWTFLASLMMSSISFAQSASNSIPRIPTRFDKFIYEKEISWASYLIDSLCTREPNVAKLFLDLFEKDALKVSSPLSFERGSQEIIYQPQSFIKKSLFPPGENSGDAIDLIKQYPVDSNVINVARIIYVKNGQLLVYIPWVSTRLFITTSSDFFIGMSEYFSTALNYAYKTKSSAYQKARFLQRTTRFISVNMIPKTDMLKEIYGRNLIEQLYAELPGSRNELVEVSSGNTIPFSAMQNFSNKTGEAIQVPVYDSLGRIQGYKTTIPSPPQSFISNLEIVEDWYYDHKKNRLLCRIPQATLFVEDEQGNASGKILRPVIKIIFKEK